MRAMVLDTGGLRLQDVPRPVPGPGQILLRVRACAVCRTDLHVVDRELPNPKLPLIPGHEIAGEVVELGPGVEDTNLTIGARAGVPWLGWTCGACPFCLRGEENLCPSARFTGYTLDGGFAEYAVADHRYAFPLPPGYSDAEAAPLLCAGLIGYRSLRMAGPGEALGLYGFGAAAHLIAQVAIGQGRRVYAFTRPGDHRAQAFARSLGARWAGGSGERPPEPLDAAILFAPVGTLVPLALAAVRPGGTVVCGGIHMSDVPSFPYALLWGERQLRSVANLTRQDARELLHLAGAISLRVSATAYPLERAVDALADLREGRLEGVAVLVL